MYSAFSQCQLERLQFHKTATYKGSPSIICRYQSIDRSVESIDNDNRKSNQNISSFIDTQISHNQIDKNTKLPT